MNHTTLSALASLALSLWLVARSAWILFVRPDPPATAVTATRRSRTLIASAIGIFGIAYLFFQIQYFV